MLPCRKTRVGNKAYELDAEGYAGLRRKEKVQRGHQGALGKLGEQVTVG